MHIVIICPMEQEATKTQMALQTFHNLKHTYEIIKSGVGREPMAKAMQQLPKHDICVLLGFTAVVANEHKSDLVLGDVVEITNASLYGYEGGLFENGKPIKVEAKTTLTTYSSLTSDKFVTTTNVATNTMINMEDYTFMFLKNENDFILRVVSDFLPHEAPIDFFKQIEAITFTKAIATLEQL